MTKVDLILGSKSDMPVAEKAIKVLKEFGVEYNIYVASAHRTPARVYDIVSASNSDVFIAIAGLSAALPGAVAAHTIKPVIGVPVSGKVNMDSILSIIQMPPGIPVAGVGLDMGDNAALLALKILALKDPSIAEKIRDYRKNMAAKVISDSESIQR